MSANGFTHYIFTYPGIFLWFAIIEQFTPVPEEVALMTVGYISMHTALNPVLCGAVSIVGLLTADNVFFYLALKGSKLSERALKKVNHKLLDKMKDGLHRHAVKTLIVMGLLPKLRFLSPVVSATTGISWKLFMIVNTTVTAFYVTVYMVIGYFFHNQLQAILKKVQLAQHGIFIGVMIIVGAVIIWGIGKYVNEKKN
jgi:membrane protein DedA with SNARE-associated domain